MNDDRGHVWERDENGERAYIEPVSDGHAGPQCVRCGFWFCQHCHPDGPPEECDPEACLERVLDFVASWGRAPTTPPAPPATPDRKEEVNHGC